MRSRKTHILSAVLSNIRDVKKLIKSTLYSGENKMYRRYQDVGKNHAIIPVTVWQYPTPDSSAGAVTREET